MLKAPSRASFDGSLWGAIGFGCGSGSLHHKVLGLEQFWIPLHCLARSCLSTSEQTFGQLQLGAIIHRSCHRVMQTFTRWHLQPRSQRFRWWTDRHGTHSVSGSQNGCVAVLQHRFNIASTSSTPNFEISNFCSYTALVSALETALTSRQVGDAPSTLTS